LQLVASSPLDVDDYGFHVYIGEIGVDDAMMRFKPHPWFCITNHVAFCMDMFPNRDIIAGSQSCARIYTGFLRSPHRKIRVSGGDVVAIQCVSDDLVWLGMRNGSLKCLDRRVSPSSRATILRTPKMNMCVVGLNVARHSRYLASVLMSGDSVKVWDVRQLSRPCVELHGHVNRSISRCTPAFDPTDRFLAATDQAGVVSVWDVHTAGECVARTQLNLDWHGGKVNMDTIWRERIWVNANGALYATQ